ncbi:MAG: STAS domain-containing protein [Polyangiaceae bacterium]|nr:STAS domain-containing protein [Polyangiaceae bacterium]
MHTDILGTQATIHLDSIVKGGEAAALMEEVKALLGQGLKAIHLDLQAVEHIDSAGLGMLVNAARRVRSSDASLDLTGLSPVIRALLQRTGLDEVFDMAPRAEGGR